MIQIVPAQAIDLLEIDVMLDLGFGPARRNRTAYQLRDGLVPDPGLSFVARDADDLIGSVQCWPLQLRDVAAQLLPLILLGPVVTAQDRQGQGIATRLVNAALATIDARDALPVLLIGDAPFYGRFGFSAAATGRWVLPGPVDRDRLLLRGGAELPGDGWIEARGVRRAA